MPSSTIDPRIIPKLSHVAGREWGGCLLPREIIAIAEAGAILNVGRRRAVALARERVRRGDRTPSEFDFEIHSGSTLSKALARRASLLPVKH